MTTSKFKLGYLFWFLWMLLCGIGLSIFLNKAIEKILNKGLSLNSLLIIFLIVPLLITVKILKDFKYIQIDSKTKKLKWYSLLAPFGRTLNFADYVGKVKSSEVGTDGSYYTTYLIDRNNSTSFRINGLFYRNFDELYKEIKLVEIKKYDMTFWLYLKLLFTGRIKIRSTTNHKK